MTTDAARRFLPTLRELGSSLRAPLPDRVRILTELEADLEALQARLERDGVSEDEARRRAIHALVPDRAVLRELERLHRPLYPRLTAGVRRTRLKMAERAALAVATAALVIVGAWALAGADLLHDRSPFLAPVLGIGAPLLAAALATAFQVWIKRTVGPPRFLLAAVLTLSALVLLVSLVGVVFDAYELSSTLEAANTIYDPQLARWVVREATLLAVAITLALFGGLVGFLTSHSLTLKTSAYRDLLGLSHAMPLFARKNTR